jgi:cysteine desulfurase/selenocysteine lyase
MDTSFAEAQEPVDNGPDAMDRVRAARADFPALNQMVSGMPLVYLDSAATTQKPLKVIEQITDYYHRHNANVHRGVHELSERATRLYEGARDKIRDFINASAREEIVFVRGTSEAINLVAQSYLRPRIGEGDEILITEMEHHSNIVPWQLVAEQTGAKLRVAPITDSGELMMDSFADMLGPRTKLVAVAHISNALGTINPVQEIIRLSHDRDIPVLLDGAQAVGHMPVDVQALDCDFYAFSGHKMYAPTGIGALYTRRDILESMIPWQGGGEMIRKVSFEKTEYNDIPHRFEAGTPAIAGAIGLGAAIDYLEALGRPAIEEWENELLAYATDALNSVPGLRMIGTARHKAGILSFVMDNVHPHDISTILDKEGVAVRAGHHCAMPLMDRLGVPATTRASLALYNNREDIDALLKGLETVRALFQ